MISYKLLLFLATLEVRLVLALTSIEDEIAARPMTLGPDGQALVRFQCVSGMAAPDSLLSYRLLKEAAAAEMRIGRLAADETVAVSGDNGGERMNE